MNNIYTIPILLACIVTLVVYFLKKDETDTTKQVSFTGVFLMVLGVTFGVVFMFGDNESSINAVLKEIHVGEPDF
jgi:hypothetical protein